MKTAKTALVRSNCVVGLLGSMYIFLASSPSALITSSSNSRRISQRLQGLLTSKRRDMTDQ
ncbi:hypothetical protein DAPPUDRAFT_306438 [Daphnia pulex]|uniref:Uncharacterized protein n=1 Tax=Daphnia pulex TaxID=6669 RepID=E9FYY5_DAPPU|nr:hypothetical protein DAPPUDRAFT_306438 [Daphnia pulex]|eukprot:EFX87615.1 hypothetical protein DAPPUDRAFT_306438 [Daphnia pulex]